MYRWTWHWPALMVSDRFTTAPIGDVSRNPPYTPTTDTVPPLRTVTSASRRASPRPACWERVDMGADPPGRPAPR